MTRFAKAEILAEDLPQAQLVRKALKTLGFHHTQISVRPFILGQNNT